MAALLAWLVSHERPLATLAAFLLLVDVLVGLGVLAWARAAVARALRERERIIREGEREREALVLEGRVAARRVVAGAVQDAIRLRDKRLVRLR